jgi:hypothetical protein
MDAAIFALMISLYLGNFMKALKYFIPFLIGLSLANTGIAQHYSAIHGSNYSGSLGVYNNPSSIVNTPYKWDLTLFGTQFQAISNALSGKNFPLYLAPSAKFRMANGNFEREAYINSNIRLLNGRYAINKNHAFAFGANFKSYTQAKTGTFNYNDSVKGTRTFLFYNENNVMRANMVSSAWLELFGTYAFTLIDNERYKLNVGATVKVLRGMSGAFARLNDVSVQREVQGNEIVNKISGGSAIYGLSFTHRDDFKFNLSEALRLSQSSIAGDIGIEYIVKTQAVATVYDENSDYDYEWKIGVSLLDLGWNKYQHGLESRSVSALKPDVSGEELQAKFSSIKTLPAFNDSLETIVDNAAQLRGYFNIFNPARAVINVDRFVRDNFYINGELSVNLLKDSKTRNVVAESRLITITPRWERRNFGFYFPVQYTTYGNLWVGGALRAGPLLLGTHNLLNAFSSHAKTSGGAYIAITIRPGEFSGGKGDKKLNCPTYF